MGDDDGLRVALIGCGWFACAVHCDTLRKAKARVVALHARTDASAARAARALKRSDLPRSVTLGGALAACDVALLCLPAAAHESACLAAFAAKVAVVSEKPAAWTAAGLRRLDAAHAAAPGAWRVLENWAHKPGVLRVGALLDGVRPVWNPNRFKIPST